MRIPITPELLAEVRALMPDFAPVVIDSDSRPLILVEMTHADEIVCHGASDIHILQHDTHIEIHAYATGGTPDRVAATGPTLIDALRAMTQAARAQGASYLQYDLWGVLKKIPNQPPNV